MIIVFSIISFILLGIVGTVIEYIFSPEEFIQRMALFLVDVIIQAYTTLGLYKLIFTVIDSEYYEFEFKQVLPSFRMLYSYLGAVFLLAFIVTNCSVAIERLDNYPDTQLVTETVVVVIALYFALRIMFFNTFIVDDGSGPIESLVQSFKLTKGYILKILAILGIIVIFIALPGVIAGYFPIASLVIIVTYPFVNIILVVTYRKLVYSHQDVDDDVSETV
ncbi:MAG TPA: hypothetical protein VFE53_00705 [Mucilaginibacter sp.]|nr:hypothetical protein [Mucilaginibacter sp.]